ncbi:hypothetical protein LCGC14_0705960 [marine sediment metagenome]|uniref:Uncharacterized protein n=1 Tax=marine sediment metagenome TaxID=412755 RepID=A0A0F9QGF6_9ZZZZ|nr:hypothetical protein [bacterium]
MDKKINIKIIREIIKSEEFITELKKLSLWASNIKQEAPIIHILTKILTEQGYLVALEWDKKNKHDMMVNHNAIIEAKFYYEEDIQHQLRLLFNKSGKNIDQLLEWLEQKIETKTSLYYDIAFYILKDIFYKLPNIFILIILSRNLLDVRENDLEIINWSNQCIKYNKKFGYNNPKTFLILQEFFEGIQKKKTFETCRIDIDANTKFPSTYHIHLFEFK